MMQFDSDQRKDSQGGEQQTLSEAQLLEGRGQSSSQKVSDASMTSIEEDEELRGPNVSEFFCEE
jgi:hypothetical protein